MFTRYLSFFHTYATQDGVEGVPDSAYFAAFEAARGVGDAYLIFAQDPTRTEVELATQRYRSALALFPFDRELWPELTAALGRHGREGDFAELVRPIAEKVTRSRAIAGWVDKHEPNAKQIATLRRAYADSLVLMYLGFADGSRVDQLDMEIGELEAKREALRAERVELIEMREALRAADVPAAPAPGSDDTGGELVTLGDVARKIADRDAQLARMGEQLQARSRALPLYRAALASKSLAPELRTRRDHPVHALLRRMYHERRASAPASAEDTSR